MRLSTLALLGLLAASSAPVGAQTLYSRLASQDELADQGRLPGIQPTCINRVFGTFIFFDDTSDQIVSYNPANAAGSRLNVLVSATDLDAVAATDVTQCRDSDAISTAVVMALSNATNNDLVFSMTPQGGSRRLVASGPGTAGITGVAIDAVASVTYLARAQFFGAPEDGIYQTGLFSVNNNVTQILTNPDLDLVGIDLADSRDIFATSSENGVGQYKNKIVRISFPQTAPSLSIVLDPFAGPNALFVNGTDGGLEDIFVEEQGNVERMFVVNNSFGGPQGETIARFNLDGSNPVLVFTEAGLIASPPAMATPTSAFTTAGGNGYMTLGTNVNVDGQVTEVFLASRNTNNGQTALFRLDVTNLPTAGEETAATAAGYALDMANPLRGSARVRITQPEAADVRVSVVDVLGREVAVLADGARGTVSDATFDTATLSPGTYVVVMRSGGYALSRTVTVVR